MRVSNFREHRPAARVALASLAGFLATFAILSSPGHSQAVGSGYTLFPDRWYQQYSDSGSYVTWMTLTTGVLYNDGTSSGTWGGPISTALTAWNNTSTTVHYNNIGYDPDNDVHIIIFRDAGDDDIFGTDYVFDQYYGQCNPGHNCTASQPRPNTWWYEWATINDYAQWSNDVEWNYNGTLTQRRTTVLIHELGHGLSLNHHDQQTYCESTIMDDDCWLSLASSYQAPKNADVCGVNNAYYDPNWGYAGC